MNQVRSVGATFVAKRTLTISKAGSGDGAVTSSPSGIDCGSTCSHAYEDGAVVTLSASPNGESTFTGWSGGGCSGSGTCQVTLASDTAVTATFTKNAPNERTLTVNKSGSGTGTVASNPAGINCGSACSHAFSEGAVVTLTPTPGSNSTFTGWSGACSGAGACQVTMDQARTVGANFDLVQRTLMISKGGSGGGSVTSLPAGINCGSTCAAKFSHGTSITLTASAASGSSFSGWSGGGCSGTGSCQATLSADTTVTANFDIQSSGGGGGGGGGGASPPSGGSPTPTPPPSPITHKKPLKCKKGLKKKKVRGKTKCVKIKHGKKKH
jgi:hypothetical protein